MALPASDNFERAGPAIGSNWTFLGGGTGLRITGSSDLWTIDPGTQEAYWNADSFPNDQYAEIVVSNFNTNDEPGVNLRCSTDGSYNRYGCYTEGTSGGYDAIERIIAGSWTNLASLSAKPAVGDTIRFEAEGTALRAYINGTLRASTTDSSHTAGAAGVGFWDSANGATIESWTAGSLAAPQDTPETRGRPYGAIGFRQQTQLLSR